MKLKKLHLTMMAAAALFCNMASAQLFIDQATFTIQAGATVTVQGDVTSNIDILGTGKVVLKGTANQNVNMGGFSVPNLEIDNAANATLTGNAKISGDLLFTNGKIVLGNNNLALGTAATITSATNAKYVVTSGTGRLIKAGLGTTAFNFPVGNSLTSYTPLAVANTGTADSIGARATAAVFSAGTTGPAYTKEVVNNTWTLTEAVAGGSNLSMTATWNAADTLLGFDRTRSGISYYVTAPAVNVGWDLLNSQTGLASGAGPFTYNRVGITSVGTFAVGTRPVLTPLLVTPKVFLQGAYNTGTGVMNDALRVANLTPTGEPYTGFGSITAALRGSGGGETAATTIIGSAAGLSSNTTVVDWVLVQLHNGAGTIISQRAALLQRGGAVVDVDGISPVNMAGNATGSYFVSIKHRNHVGVKSTASIALAKTTNTNYDFSTGLDKAATPALNTAMTNKYGSAITTPVFMMWGGNANGNANTRYSGPANDEGQLLNSCLGSSKANTVNGYLNCDLNMNGAIRYSGPNNDEGFLLNTVLLSNKATTISQPVPNF